MITLGFIIHSNSPDENRQLIRKCMRALNPGGQLVIQDWIMSDDRTEPSLGALFALNMLAGTQAGDTFTESEIKQWKTASGIGRMKRVETGFGVALMMGRKK